MLKINYELRNRELRITAHIIALDRLSQRECSSEIELVESNKKTTELYLLFNDGIGTN